MDNEPQGQAGKRVVDSFSLKIAGRERDCRDRDCDDSSSLELVSARAQATLANKIKPQQTKRANELNTHTMYAGQRGGGVRWREGENVCS